jgi:DNA-binding GntR family transcriptional regulator
MLELTRLVTGSRILDVRKIKREPPMADMAIREIRTAILSGSLRPGTRIRQEDLAERLAVSRAPIRQALAVLERDGLIRTDRERGTVVAPLDPTFISDLYAFRGIVERGVGSMLASRDDFDSAKSREIIVAGIEATNEGDFARLIDLDLKFHTQLYEAVGNQVLTDVMRAHWTHIRRVMSATLTITGYRKHVWEEHAAIIDAIDAHNPERAGQLSEAHTQAASATLIQRLAHEAARAPSEEEPRFGKTGRRGRGAGRDPLNID